jgi:hypothetical protein
MARLTKADDRWMSAMTRKGYRDDPDEADAEGKPFTERDWGLYGWADAWRLAVHRIENELDKQPEMRRLAAEASAFASYEPTFAEAEMTVELLASQTRSLRSGNRADKPPRKGKSPKAR